MSKTRVSVLAATLSAASLLLFGCGTQVNNPHPVIPANEQGLVHGGEEPVTGATIQLYAVGATALGSPATPLLTSPVLSDTNGNFTITGKYTCPSASTLVYVTAIGGNPGLPTGTNNTALALMAALGPCGSLSASTFIYLNELTTVAAVYALAPYMASLSAIGSDAAKAPALASAFTLASEFVNTSSGTTPGTNVPPGYLVPIQQINTLADILASCVNSAGGASGDNSACGNLFSLTTLPTGSTAPTNTISALLQIANNLAANTASLYALIAPNAPFQPAQPQVPPDLAVRLLANTGLTVSPTVLTFPPTPIYSTLPPQTVTFTNNTATPIGLDAVDPDHFSLVGTDAGSFSLASAAPTTCYSPLQPGATCSVQITFKPSAAAAFSAYYVIPNSSANPSIAVTLNATGIPPSGGMATLNPTSLVLGAAGTPSPITLTNSGTAPLTVYGVTISNDPTSGQPAFSQINTCGTTVAAGAACTISVTALASAPASATAVLTVYDDAQFAPQIVNLSFSDGLQISFPSLAEGTSFTGYLQDPSLEGYPNPITLTITGPDAADFSFSPTSSVLTTTCTSPTRPPNPCVNPVTFTPSAQGTRTATLNAFGDNFNGAIGGLSGVGLPPGPHIAFLQPYLPPEDVAPLNSLSMQFATALGQSGSGTATILNNGTVPLTLGAPVITGPNASEFTATTTCTPALAPGATCTLNANFTPAQSGPRTANLTLADTTNATSPSLSLQGIGVPAPPVANPSLLNFPYTPAGSVSSPLSFTVTAANNDPVFLKMDPSMAALDPFLFYGPTSCPQTPCTLSLVYAPTAATIAASPGGQNPGYVAVYDQTTFALTPVVLGGAYLPPFDVTVSPASIDFGTQPINTISSAGVVTVTNIGSQEINFSASFDAQDTTFPNSNFSISGNPQVGDPPTYSVNPGQSANVYVTFSPPFTGPVTATLYIFSNASTSPNTIQLSGTGQ